MHFLPHILSGLFLLALKVFVVFLCLAFAVGLFIFGAEILLAFFYPLYLVTLAPVLWAVRSIWQTRCPKCRGFFKRKLVGTESFPDQEVLRSVPKTDTGVIYSNRLFEPNQTIEFTHDVQVPFVQSGARSTWTCKDPLCGHEWTTERYWEYEGSLDD